MMTTTTDQFAELREAAERARQRAQHVVAQRDGAQRRHALDVGRQLRDGVGAQVKLLQRDERGDAARQLAHDVALHDERLEPRHRKQTRRQQAEPVVRQLDALLRSIGFKALSQNAQPTHQRRERRERRRQRREAIDRRIERAQPRERRQRRRQLGELIPVQLAETAMTTTHSESIGQTPHLQVDERRQSSDDARAGRKAILANIERLSRA